MQTIDDYLSLFRISQTEFARLINGTPQRVYAWRKKGYFVQVEDEKLVIYKKIIERDV